MPDERGRKKASEKDLPDTPLHAYKDGREEDVEGDAAESGESTTTSRERGTPAEGKTRGVGSKTGGLEGGRPSEP